MAVTASRPNRLTTTLKTITEDLEVLTPAFVAGADPHISEDELREEGIRPTAVASGLRWWFRAVAGGFWGSQNLSEIRNAEGLIFGSAYKVRRGEEKWDGLASRVAITVETLNLTVKKIASAKDLTPAQAYLGYGLFNADRKETWTRACILPGSKFRIVLEYVPEPRSAGEPAIREDILKKLLHAWIRFGGLGGRSRHGLGSMALLGPSGQETMPAFLLSIITTFRTYLGTIRNPSCIPQPDIELPQYPVFHPRWMQGLVSPQTFNTADEALGETFRLWRTSRLSTAAVGGYGRQPRGVSTRNRDLYRRLDTGQLPPGRPTVEFAGLGLPIPFGFPQTTGHTGSVTPVNLERRATPIWFRVVRMPAPGQGGMAKYQIAALLWRCQYLPPGLDATVNLKIHNSSVEAYYDARESEMWFDKVLVKENGWKRI
jgi:CRISPR type III-B/RAMP module RAMP protein Cmr1